MTTIGKPSLTTAFRKLDTDRDGNLSTQELSSGIEKAAKGWVPGGATLAKNLVKDHDADHDGKLNWREAQRAAGDLSPGLKGMPVDKNGDGKVDRNEVSAWVKQKAGPLGGALAGPANNALLAFADADGDGVINVKTELEPLIGDITAKARTPTTKPDDE
jgi:Ca2+-binding EF-hand superfamily protein